MTNFFQVVGFDPLLVEAPAGTPGATGATGSTGATPNVQVGTVSTLPAGSNASATMGGTVDNPLLNLGIPQGALANFQESVELIGAAGAALTLSAPSVATVHDVTLSASSCAITLPSGFPGPGAAAITLVIRQDGTGGRAITFAGPTITWLGDGTQPAIKTTAGSVTVICFQTLNNGTSYFGTGTTVTVPSAHHATHEPGGTDALDLTTINRAGTLASRPAAASNLAGVLYYATDERGGTLYRCTGTAWVQVAQPNVSALAPTTVTWETYTRMGATVTNRGALTSARMFVMAIELPAGVPISTVTWFAATTAGAGCTHMWSALFDKNRNQLAVSTDDTSTTWAANAPKTFTLSAPFTTTYAGTYYIGLTVVATTVPTLFGCVSNGFVTGLAPAVCGNADSGLSTPATCPATFAAITATADMLYAGVA